mmetsp:Transcript_38168/g.75093  ORF Transcript_38168/g.75093 Transcript_38168/m.75093 type:complete len:423 (+) Transcript_38168:50-1318(+)
MRQQTADFLRNFSHSSQESAVRVLTQSGSHFESYWITNSIFLSNLSLSVLELLDQGSVGQFKVLKATTVSRLAFASRSASTVPTGGSLSWNIEKIQADKCWAKGINGTGVVVATIDGGVRYTHNALRANYRGTLSDGSFDHDYNWVDYAYKNKVPFDSDGHGTNVAGVLSGSQDSGVGVAPGAKWISAKAFNYAGYADDKWLVASAQWVLCPSPINKATPTNCSLGADVVSASWGLDDDHTPLLEQYVNAWVKAGTVPVFAVGNNGPQCSTVFSPADYKGVVSVAATDKTDSILAFSSRGPPTTTDPSYNVETPAISAPGFDVEGPSCDDDHTYKGYSGTSQACPHVAGVAALVLSIKPGLNVSEVASILYSSAETASLSAPSDGPSSCGGVAWNQYPNYIYGHGRLDALAAVQAAQTLESY